MSHPPSVRLAVSLGAVLVSFAGAATAGVASAGAGTDRGTPDLLGRRTALQTVEIQGRGYGHGRGMSQHGAQSRALAGHGATRILDFYYPGTHTDRVQGRIRVLLTTPVARGLVVRHQQRLSVRRVETGARWRLPDLAGGLWRLRWTDPDTTTLEFRRAGRWQPSPRGRWRSIDGPAELVGGGPVELVGGGASSSYRGGLRTYGGRPEDMGVVNSVGLDLYLFGVVPRESPFYWRPAALQAQSVAARTYAQSHRVRAMADGAGYDLCDTSACQVYGGLDAEQHATNAAVQATSGDIRTWGGQPIIAEFGSSNGGQTVGTSLPYQRFRADRFDAADDPNASWSTSVPAGTVASRWSLGALQDVQVRSRDGHGDWGGRVTSLRLVGSDRTEVVTGEEFRLGLGLRSTYLRLRTVG